MLSWVKTLKVVIVSKIRTVAEKYLKEHPLDKEERIKWACVTLLKIMEAKAHFGERTPANLSYIDKDVYEQSIHQAITKLKEKGLEVKVIGKYMHLEWAAPGIVAEL